MIKQIKMGFRMIPYAYGLSGTAIFGILFFLLGFIAYCVSPIRGMGAYFLAIGATWTSQLLYSLAASNMLQSSKWKKRFETSIPALIDFVIAFIIYALAFLICVLVHWRAGDGREGLGLVTCGLVMFVIMTYSGWAYKFYAAATIVFIVVLWGIMIPERLWLSAWMSWNPSFGISAALGLLLIIVGALAQYGISLLVYRVPLSKRAQYKGLRKWM